MELLVSDTRSSGTWDETCPSPCLATASLFSISSCCWASERAAHSSVLCGYLFKRLQLRPHW